MGRLSDEERHRRQLAKIQEDKRRQLAREKQKRDNEEAKRKSIEKKRIEQAMKKKEQLKKQNAKLILTIKKNNAKLKQLPKATVKKANLYVGGIPSTSDATAVALVSVPQTIPLKNTYIAPTQQNVTFNHFNAFFPQIYNPNNNN
jgi:D-arabinose 1-dehydrogenase-like Zn-dependent alcohol dehydrogenase